jgi:hypothetical protein
VRDDHVAGDQLYEVADGHAQRAEVLACSRAVMAVSAQALERDDDTAMIAIEPLWTRER